MLRIDHETRLTYTEPVIESVIEVRMTPPSNEDQTILGHKIRVMPPAATTAFRDGFGNRAELFSVVPPHGEVTIQAATCIRCHRRQPETLLAGVPWPVDASTSIEAAEFLRPSPLTEPSEALWEFCRQLPTLPGTLLAAVNVLLCAVRDRLSYTKEMTDVSTTISKALELGHGVCQDYAHLFIATCRQLGLPTRYVSGYVNEPGEIATHAWCQIWTGPTTGWVDVDPTRKIFAGNEHVLTAVGRDYSDVPPNKGVWKGADAKETIAVLVNVRSVDRVPTDLTDLAAPAWTSSSAEETRNINSRSFIQQQRRIAYRQQQSQQQQ